MTSLPTWLSSLLHYFSAVRAIAAAFVTIVGSIAKAFVVDHSVDWTYFTAGFVICFVLVILWIIIMVVDKRMQPVTALDINAAEPSEDVTSDALS